MPGKPYCPVPGPLDGPAYPLAELEPLFDQLRASEPLAGRYKVGTLCSDGRLDLCKQSLGLDGVRRLPTSPFVSSLLLGTNGLGDPGAAEVGRLVRGSPTLSTLYLGCNYIGREGMESLGEALAEVNFSGAVWLKRNPLGYEGGRALARSLRKGFAPVCLDLEQCALGNAGAELILEALLEAGCPLRRLSLAGNQLGPELLPDLRRFLQECPSIQALQLGANRLAGLQPFSLRELGLASNGITDSHVAALLESQIEELDLGAARMASLLGSPRNHFSDDSLKTLANGSWARLLLNPADVERIPLPEGVSFTDQPPMWFRARRSQEDPVLAAVRSRYRKIR